MMMVMVVVMMMMMMVVVVRMMMMMVIMMMMMMMMMITCKISVFLSLQTLSPFWLDNGKCIGFEKGIYSCF